MRTRSLVLLALFVVPLFAGCGDDPLPAIMVGGYARDVTYPDGNHRLHLDVTPTGMTITGGPLPTTVPLGAPTAGVVKVGAAGSVLFKSLKCFNDYSCTFKTDNGCEGSLTRDSSPAIVLVATKDCETWSGKWVSEKDAPPPSTGTAAATEEPSATATAHAIPAAPASATATATASGTPSATATASGTATAALPTSLPTTLPTSLPTSIPTSSPKVDCLSACNATNVACVRECKVGDLDCMKKCSSTMVTCATKCP